MGFLDRLKAIFGDTPEQPEPQVAPISSTAGISALAESAKQGDTPVLDSVPDAHLDFITQPRGSLPALPNGLRDIKAPGVSASSAPWPPVLGADAGLRDIPLTSIPGYFQSPGEVVSPADQMRQKAREFAEEHKNDGVEVVGMRLPDDSGVGGSGNTGKGSADISY